MQHEADLFWANGSGSAQSNGSEAVALFHVRRARENSFPIEKTARPEISDSYMEGQDSERLRLGRELHDSTGQLLLALRLGVAHLRQAQADGASDEILDEIEETVRQIDLEIRTLSFMSYPAELGSDDLVTVLDQLARGFGKRTGLKVKFQTCCKLAQAAPLVAAALLRIAQEAMTNVHRHARASAVQVSLVEHRGLVELIIKDDGCGLPPPNMSGAGGVGLQGMRHRIERLGGSLKIWRLRKGTKVAASLPNAQFYAAKGA